MKREAQITADSVFRQQDYPQITQITQIRNLESKVELFSLTVMLS